MMLCALCSMVCFNIVWCGEMCFDVIVFGVVSYVISGVFFGVICVGIVWCMIWRGVVSCFRKI